MPQAPPKPCRAYGCRYYQVRHGYCEAHQHLYVPRYKRDNRLPASQRGYGTAWNTFAWFYKHKHPLCAKCGHAIGQRGVVHHIIPLEDGGDKYDEANLMPLCRQCHEKEHGRAS